MMELQNKYETVLEAYNKELKKRIELEDKLMRKSTRPRITYPHPPMEPFKSTPLIEIPDTPQRPEYYIAKDFEEEKNQAMSITCRVK